MTKKEVTQADIDALNERIDQLEIQFRDFARYKVPEVHEEA